MKRIMICVAMLTLASVAPRMAAAECIGHCDHCGCECQCCKFCKLVPDVKKVPKVTYACECEDVCIPGKSCIIGYKCECDDDCDCGRHRHPEPIWQPSCGRVITRHKLVKIETVKEVKTFKCVVVNCCPRCQAALGTPEQQAARIAASWQSGPASDPTGPVTVANVEPVGSGPQALPAEGLATSAPAEPGDVQLASHESNTPSLVDRLKRSFQPILGK